MFQITTCPTCGSDRIRKVRKDWQGEYEGRKFAVINLEFFECPACGEKLYDRETMRRIEARSPAFLKTPVTG
ncbi:MAG: YgiT-type zinc finger protein [Pirellulales bacterium]|nr:YgiT-type zinc finger protein [Pirellulales bacterium]